MIKKLVAGIIVGTALFTPMTTFASEIKVSGTELKSELNTDLNTELSTDLNSDLNADLKPKTEKQIEEVNISGGSAKTLNTMITAAMLGNNNAEVDGIDTVEGEVTGGFTDKWLLAITSQVDGFGGIDTSEFKTFATSNNLANNLYNINAAKMLESGWGRVPSDGLFSNANGFEGYKISGATNITAQDLFATEFKDVYSSFKNGTFNSDMPGLKEMTKSFNDSFSKEMSNFASSDIYKTAKSLINSVDINQKMKEFSNTPNMMSAASLAGVVNSNQSLVDSKAASIFAQNQANVASRAVMPLAQYQNADGSVDVMSLARNQYDQVRGALKTNVGWDSVEQSIALGKINGGGLVKQIIEDIGSNFVETFTSMINGDGGRTLDSKNYDTYEAIMSGKKVPIMRGYNVESYSLNLGI